MKPLYDPNLIPIPNWSPAAAPRSMESIMNPPAPMVNMASAYSPTWAGFDFENAGLSSMPSGNPLTMAAGVGPVAGGGSTPGFMQSDWWKGAFGGYDPKTGERSNGAAGAALGGVQALANLWMGMKNYGLMKKQLAFSQDSFNRNFAAQASTTNSRLEDRQAARVASNAGAYESVASYMDKNRIKG